MFGNTFWGEMKNILYTCSDKYGDIYVYHMRAYSQIAAVRSQIPVGFNGLVFGLDYVYATYKYYGIVEYQVQCVSYV